MPDRRQSRILTFDRALLIGVFGIGGWVAVNDFRAGNLVERVQAMETKQAAIEAHSADHHTEIAVINTKLENIEKAVTGLSTNVAEMAKSTTRLANVAREPQ